MELRCSFEKNVFVIKVNGDIDNYSAQTIKEFIKDSILKYKCYNVILDMKNVYFMDSSGIGMLIGRYKELSLYCGEIVLANINKSIDKILALSGIYKILKTFDNNNLAIEYLTKEK